MSIIVSLLAIQIQYNNIDSLQILEEGASTSFNSNLYQFSFINHTTKYKLNSIGWTISYLVRESLNHEISKTIDKFYLLVKWLIKMWDELHKWSMNKIWKYEEKKILKSQIAFTCFIFGGSSAVHDKIMLKSINPKKQKL